jgi:hypothetical protein
LDAAFGVQKINQASNDIQARGWWFNRESKWFLTPDSVTGKIKKPNNVMSVTSWAGSRNADLTIRGDYIYDRITHGTVLTVG